MISLEEYEIVIPYFFKFNIQSEKKLTILELLEKCHNEGDGSIIGYADGSAVVNLGELKEV